MRVLWDSIRAVKRNAQGVSLAKAETWIDWGTGLKGLCRGHSTGQHHVQWVWLSHRAHCRRVEYCGAQAVYQPLRQLPPTHCPNPPLVSTTPCVALCFCSILSTGRYFALAARPHYLTISDAFGCQ